MLVEGSFKVGDKELGGREIRYGEWRGVVCSIFIGVCMVNMVSLVTYTINPLSHIVRSRCNRVGGCVSV
jgi:hypothetical protein